MSEVFASLKQARMLKGLAVGLVMFGLWLQLRPMHLIWEHDQYLSGGNARMTTVSEVAALRMSWMSQMSYGYWFFCVALPLFVWGCLWERQVLLRQFGGKESARH